jgi:hypothetical protein
VVFGWFWSGFRDHLGINITIYDQKTNNNQ